MQASELNRLDKLEQLVESNTQAIAELSKQVQMLSDAVAELRSDLKDWFGWLRLVSGVIILTVGVSFLGIVLPLGFSLWRQTLN